ncbi:MAG: hypothetical protein ACOYN4_00510 [Bacteroidales bacterium]
MKQISLQYQQLGFKYKISTSLPEIWSELTPKQLIAVAKNHSVNANETLLLAALLGIKEKQAKQMDNYQRFSIARELTFLQDFKPFYSFIIRTIKGLSAPRPRLEGMSFGQFMYVDTYHEVAVMADDPTQLNKFVACLYLPDGKPFDEKLIQDRADHVALFLLPEQKTAISLNYRLVKEWICKQYPLLFQVPHQDGQDNEQTHSTEKKRGSDWVKVYESLVGDDIVNQDKYAELPLHHVFRFLTQKLKENARR